MAPFRRGRSTPQQQQSRGGAMMVSRQRSSSRDAAATRDGSAPAADAKGTESAWESRRRRKQKNSNSRTSSSDQRRKKDDLPVDEYDPYDSDPGESYREHCERLKGEKNRSCLTMPRFLQNHTKISAETSTEATAPPSPLFSGTDDFPGGTTNAPASLPKDLARVRYSLRTSISDGSQPQALAANLMERRDLRPNNVHINVSHWSDFGGRNYMEDR